MRKKQSKKRLLQEDLDMATSFMFPGLHQSVVHAVEDIIVAPQFHNDNNNDQIKKKYATHVMGKFVCANKGCHASGWGSKKVAVLIRMYIGNRYNAVVFNQRCKRCDRLGTFQLDESSYIERVAYRLKRWAGVSVEPCEFSSKKGLPHKADLCEGCRQGYCQRAGQLSI